MTDVAPSTPTPATAHDGKNPRQMAEGIVFALTTKPVSQLCRPGGWASPRAGADLIRPQRTNDGMAGVPEAASAKALR